MKILAFAASNNLTSINKQLVSYASSLATDATSEVIDINDYELPIYRQDREEKLGQPELAQAFYNKITEADAIIVSFAEHNGTYTAAYKNLFDWVSRINMKVFQKKAVIYLATSIGPSGGNSVLTAAANSAPFFDADLKGSLSIPSFFDNFDVEAQRLSNEVLDKELRELVAML